MQELYNYYVNQKDFGTETPTPFYINFGWYYIVQNADKLKTSH